MYEQELQHYQFMYIEQIIYKGWFYTDSGIMYGAIIKRIRL